MIKSSKDAIRSILISLRSASRRHLSPELEPVYQQLFRRDLKQANLKDSFYPVGWAANYAFLYTVLRIALELQPTKIVDIGAGETTHLLSELMRSGKLSGSIETIEHNEEWIPRWALPGGHEISNLPLVLVDDTVGSYYGYSLVDIRSELIDLLIVDGPPAGDKGNRFARHGALGLVDRLRPEGFVMLVDDAERHGEMLLVERVKKRMITLGLNFKMGAVCSNKKLVVFAGGAYVKAAYF